MKTYILSQKQRSAFTLVELLVVVAIIGMLAALILPAVQAARENGRRTQCLNNQNQLALAVLNFEAKKNAYPPLQGYLKQTVNASSGVVTGASPITWVAYLLPEIENVPAWTQIQEIANATSTWTAPTVSVFNLKLPLLQCPSAGLATDALNINYVANAGPDGSVTAASPNMLPSFGVFFDNVGASGAVLPAVKLTSEWISNHNGTANTLLISENEDAGWWIDSTKTTLAARDSFEIGFFYPATFLDSATAATPVPAAAGTWDGTTTPVFINLGRSNSSNPAGMSEEGARPSSGHPGVVVVAFADRHTRVIKEDVDAYLFQLLMRPNTGVLPNLSLLD